MDSTADGCTPPPLAFTITTPTKGKVIKGTIDQPANIFGHAGHGRDAFISYLRTQTDRGFVPMVPDLLQREFTAPMPGLRLIGDISCFPTGEGRLYLATVLDLCSKELIGYAIAPHMRAGLAVEAITAAHRAGLVAGNAIMHTDRGGQYHSTAHRNALRRLEIRQSTSRTGSCLDGATAESFFATIKTEIGPTSWPDRASARRDIENWIIHYNQRRLHSSLGYRTPAETRTAWQHRISAAA